MVLLILAFACVFAWMVSSCRHFFAQTVGGDVYFASMMIAMCHSSAVILATTVSLLDLQSDVLTHGHNALIAFSLGYFLSDFPVILWVRYSLGFVIHHVVAITCLVGFLYYGRGAFLLLWFLFLAEVTNPLQNLICMVKDKDTRAPPRKDSRTLDLVFRIAFCVTRFVVAPLFICLCQVQGRFGKLAQDTDSYLLPGWCLLSVGVILSGSVLFLWQESLPVH